MNWYFLASTLLCAGFVQGLTGFGFGLVSMSLLPLFMNVKQAAAISTVFSLLATITTFARHSRDYNWRLGFPFLVSVGVGVPFGVYFLEKTAEPTLIHMLGVVMLALAVREFFFNRKMEAFPSAMTVPLGVFSGGLSGAFNLGGTPTAAYAYANPWSRGQIMAFLQVMITLSCLLRMIFYARFGYLRDFSWKHAALLVPLYAAIALGHWALEKIPPKRMKQGVYVFITVTGLYYLFLH